MKSLRNIPNFEDFILESKDEDIKHYMFFGNLKTIKRNAEMILSMDPEYVDSIIYNGHDWASDHVSVANDNLDQVADFLMDYVDSNESSSYVSPQEKERKQREAEIRLKDQIKKITQKLREDPEKSDIYKLELEIAHSKMETFSLQKQLKILKERRKKS